MNNKLQAWWDNLDNHTKNYLKKQPIWHDHDLYRAAIVGGLVGFFVGVIVGFEWAWRPVITVIRPLVG